MPESIVNCDIREAIEYTGVDGYESIEFLDVSNNRLCSLSTVIEEWLTERSPRWKVKQDCSTSVIFNPVKKQPDNSRICINQYTKTIEYIINSVGKAEIILYTPSGKKLTTILNRTMPPGRHTTRYDSGTIPPGTYILRLSTPEFTSSMKVAVVR